MVKKVLILGAGYAGIEAALTLQKKKKKDDNIEVSLIEKNQYHTLLTELHEVAGNRISEEGVIVPLGDIFKYTDVKIIKDEITKFDLDKNKLLSDTTEYQYDYLILGAGSQPNFYGIPGMEENCFPLWSFKDAIRIREHIKECFSKAENEKNPQLRSKLLTFIVGGGGFTGVEMIGELAHYVKSLCKSHGIQRNEVKLMLIEALPTILPVLKKKSVDKTMRYLAKTLKVDVLTGEAITKLNEDSVELKSGKKINTSTLIWTAGVRASCITDEMDLEKSKGCRLAVNEYAQTKNKNVYAIGDLSAFISEGHTLPALVEAAIQTGKGAAKNVIADIRGKEKEKIKPKLHGVMVSVGSFFAVTDLMGWQLPRPLAVIMKYMVNIHYLFGIGGFELVFRYLRHELLEKRQDKLIIEKHYTALTPSFWLVPIRVFLGYSWLMEGINKINEGWLNNAVLSKLVPDATSSASTTEAATTVAESSVRISIPAYTWVFKTFIIPHSILFQTLIIFSEMLLGIALITGTFTLIAGLVSLGLNANFILSTGMYTRDLWYIFAALCVLGGAGRAFGVDHYLLPYLMRQWRYFVRNRRIKLFLFR